MNEYREYNSSEGNIPDGVSQIEGNLADIKILKKFPKVPKIDLSTVHCRIRSQQALATKLAGRYLT